MPLYLASIIVHHPEAGTLAQPEMSCRHPLLSLVHLVAD